MSQINVVPYIDVMLVLLIIFMVTAPLLQQGVEIDLPEAPAETLPEVAEQREPLIVSVDREGRYYLNRGDEREQALSVEDLSGQVREALTEEPDLPIYVRGDEQAGYGQVVRAMVLLQQAGAQGVGLITDSSPKPREE